MKYKSLPLSLIALFVILVPAVLASGWNVALNTPAVMFRLLLDIMLAGGIISIYIGYVFAGELKTSFNYIFIGLGIFAISHLIDTIAFIQGVIPTTGAIMHRIGNVVAYVFVIYGFYRVRKVISSLKTKEAA